MGIQLILLGVCAVGLVAAQTDTRVYRDDGRCGPGYPAPNGVNAICPGQCCSAAGYCGSQNTDCDHLDYREHTPAIPTGPPLNVIARYLPYTNIIHVSYDPPAIDQRNAVITRYHIYYSRNSGKEISKSTTLNYFAIGATGDSSYMFRVAAATLAGPDGIGPRSNPPIGQWSVRTPSWPNVISTEHQIYRNVYDPPRCGVGYLAPNGEDAICLGKCCSSSSHECVTCGVTDTSHDYTDLDLVAVEAALTAGNGNQDIECYTQYNAADYRGRKSKTETGKTCQYWSLQSPHSHNFTPEKKPGLGLGDHNFCRHSGSEPRPWCYTNDPSVRWEYCDVGSASGMCSREPTTAPTTVAATTPVFVDTRNFRDDGRCGRNFRAPNGGMAICPGECCTSTYDGYCALSNQACGYNIAGERYPVTPPTGPPLNVKVQYLPASNLILLTWDLPAINERNAIISKYKVEHYVNNDSWDNKVKNDLRLKYWTIENPLPSTRYSYRVTAWANTGWSPTSDWVDVLTPDLIFTETQVYRNDSKCGSGFLAPNGEDGICPGECCEESECYYCRIRYSNDYRELDLIALENRMEAKYPIADRPVPPQPTTPEDTESCDQLLMEFVFSIPRISSDYPPRVLITTRLPVDVKVTIVGTDFQIATTVTGYASIPLPSSVGLSSPGKASDKTVRVTAKGVISVHCIDTPGQGDGFSVLPINQLGKQHRIVSYYSSSKRAGLSVSATDKTTSVTIRNDRRNIDSQVTLNPYESYRVDGGDLTGTLVESTYPVAVVSCAQSKVPYGGYAGYESYDGLSEQVTPVKNWGSKFVLGPFLGKPSGYLYRVLTGSQSASLNISNNGRIEQVNANDWFEADVSGETVISIESDTPVLVVQYMKQGFADNEYGDSAMVIVPSMETFVNNVTFPVFDYSNMDSNIHVTINCTFANDLTLDDATSMSSWERLQSSDGEMCVIRGSVTTGVHTVSHHDPAAKFTVTVYGLRSHDYSNHAYIYSAGFQSIAKLATSATESNQPSTGESFLTIATSTEHESFSQGDDIVLVCENSDPGQPVWKSPNGELIFPVSQGGSDRINTKCASSSATKLAIYNAHPTDSGVYTCFVGSQKNTISIYVTEAPPTEVDTAPDPEEQQSTGSSSYIRWGRSECPNTANDLVYSGYGSGTNWQSSGGGTNYLCLHETPEYDRPVPGFGSNRAYIDGVEFRATDFPPLVEQNQFDINCAVCRVATRGTMVMIPARMTCPSGWTREYYGYLMGNKWDNSRSEFICVDTNPDAVPGTGENESGATIYPVEVRCLETDPSVFRGGLPCDKFPAGNELSCVVCTK